MQKKMRRVFLGFKKTDDKIYSKLSDIKKAIRDLSEIEEQKDRSFFREIGVKAATNAINENKALGIPITFIEDGWVVNKMPGGSIEQVTQVEGYASRRKLTKGTVLHVKKATH